MRTTIIVAALSLIVAGCGARPAASEQEEVGAARFIIGSENQRALQYLASDIKAVKVTLKDADDGTVLKQQVFTGAALAAKLPVNGHSFAFTVQNLKVADAGHPAGYRYKATVEAFGESAATTSLGSSTSNAFSVVSAQTTTIGMPNLALAPTPTGTWQLTVKASPQMNYVVEGYVLSLEQTNRQVATTSISTSLTSITRTFNNVVAFPTGVSTLSVKVDGRRTVGQKEAVSKSGILTASIQPGGLATSSITLALP